MFSKFSFALFSLWFSASGAIVAKSQSKPEIITSLSRIDVVPTTVIANRVYAILPELARPQTVEIWKPTLRAFGVSNGLLAYLDDDGFAIANLRTRTVERALQKYTVLNAEWKPGSRTIAVLFQSEAQTGVLLYAAGGSVATVLEREDVSSDLLRWSAYGQKLFFVKKSVYSEASLVSVDVKDMRRTQTRAPADSTVLRLVDESTLRNPTLTLGSDRNAVLIDNLKAQGCRQCAYTPVRRVGPVVLVERTVGELSTVLVGGADREWTAANPDHAAWTLSSSTSDDCRNIEEDASEIDLGLFDGVHSYATGGKCKIAATSYRDGRYMGTKGQPEEYVRRYYAAIYGVDLYARAGGMRAHEFYRMANAMGLERYENGGSRPPQIGDILTSDFDYGHVAIVRSVSTDAVCLAQQGWKRNPSDVDGSFCLPMSSAGLNYTVAGFDSRYSVRGWLRLPKPPEAITDKVVRTFRAGL